MVSLHKELENLKREGMLRRLQPLSGRSCGTVESAGRRLVNLSSNDYLGLASDPSLLQEFYALMGAASGSANLADIYGLGVASSRLLTGDLPLAHQLEALLASLYGAQNALLFNSGYHANIGIIPALFGKNDLILSDKLNHASLHDGLRLGRAHFKRFRHTDYDHLQKLLAEHRHNYDRCLIVSESVFSMDGDCADLAALTSLKREFDCLIYLDEAHAIGLYGKQGLGLAEREGVVDQIDLLVGMFGKACGSVGAFLVSTDEIRDYLVNHSRSLIFTTGLPPVVLNWNYFVLQRIPEMTQRREHLQQLSRQLRALLRKRGLKTGGETNIVPVIIGSASQAVAGAKYLQEQGFLVLPVRPPTVPSNTSRFRLSLTADLRWGQIEALPDLISDWLAGQT